MDKQIFDITIIGGGPTGLFAAFYAGLRNASCKIVDSLPALGGRLTALYPEKYIYDVAGFPKVLTRDLVDNLVAQAKEYNPTVCLGETALDVRKTEDHFILTTDKGEHLTRAVVLAGGVGTYKPKKHTCPGAEKFENAGIHYAVTDKSQFKGKRILVAGGGDSALDWANELAGQSSALHLVHRSEKFRAHDDSVKKLHATKAVMTLNTEIAEFRGDDKLKSVVLRNLTTLEETVVEVDDAIIMFGFNSSLGKIKEWGLEIRGDYIAVNEKMETNIPGIYAAGDIVDHAAKLKLIATGFSEAAIAVNFAKHFINPKEKVQPLHSTTIMEIKEKKAAREKAAAESGS